MDDSGWIQGVFGKGLGWGNFLDIWDDVDKWGIEDRFWGNKEGIWDKVVVDEGDKEIWFIVGLKGIIGDKLEIMGNDFGFEKGQYFRDFFLKIFVFFMGGKLENIGFIV